MLLPGLRMSMFYLSRYRFYWSRPTWFLIILIIQYVTNQATRFIVRAIGELAEGAEHVDSDKNLFGNDEDEDEDISTATPTVHNSQSKNEKIDYKLYKPTVVGDDWIVSETDLCMNLNHFKIYSVTH